MGFPTMRFELQLENPFISNYIKIERKELNQIYSSSIAPFQIGSASPYDPVKFNKSLFET